MPKKSTGFTLIELLVVISIIAILSVVGMVFYQNIRTNALKSKRLADLNAIKKAYETNYDPTLNGGQGGYKGIVGANFANGIIPTTDGQSLAADNSNSYIVTGAVGVNTSSVNYAACINTLDGSSCTSSTQANCSCIKSDQGTPFTSPTGGDNPSCDPYGVLSNGLVAYWKFDEASWNGNCSTQTAMDAKGSNNLQYCRYNSSGSPISGGGGTISSGTGKFAQAFNITNGTDALTTQSSTNLNPGTGSMTWTGWFKTAIGNGGTIYRKSGSNNAGGVNIIINGAIRCDVHYQPQITANSFASTYANDQWHFFACVLDRNTQKLLLYADGNLPQIVDESSINSTDLNLGNVILGTAGTTSYSPGPPASGYTRLNGSIDDLRIYNRALSSTEVAALRNNGTGCVQ